jgi:toxin ParE1/3/4
MSVGPYSIKLLPQARRDINEIWFQIVKVNPPAAEKLLTKFDERVLSLRQFPDRGAPRDELIEGLRMLVEGKYLIFYRVSGKTVEVVRVLHGAQNLMRQFE